MHITPYHTVWSGVLFDLEKGPLRNDRAADKAHFSVPASCISPTCPARRSRSYGKLRLPHKSAKKGILNPVQAQRKSWLMTANQDDLANRDATTKFGVLETAGTHPAANDSFNFRAVNLDRHAQFSDPIIP